MFMVIKHIHNGLHIADKHLVLHANLQFVTTNNINPIHYTNINHIHYTAITSTLFITQE
jgi:hypothetical protein